MSAILIIGGGSIGQRHLRNLLSLNEKDITLVETSPERRVELGEKFPITVVASLEEVTSKFEIAFICSPSAYHLDQAAWCLERGMHTFVEKPLAHTPVGLEALCAVAAQKKLVTMVGSNWKFYPLFTKMKELLDEEAVGKILSARCQFGQYLPDWHPWEDYRKGYSANKHLGGGILLDAHEFDYLTWFMGRAKKVACFADKISSLEIDVEDTAEVILRFDNGAMGEIHLDYTQRFYQRNFEFFGETGTIMWDTNLKKVVLQKKDEALQEFSLADDYDINDMYVAELKHFLGCVRSGEETITPLLSAAKVVELISAAKESAEKSVVVSLK